MFGLAALAVLLLPAALLYAGVFLYPIGALLGQSVTAAGHWSLAQYDRVFAQPLYLTILARTVRISALVTLACLLLGYPVALWLTRLRGAALAFGVACVLLPLWTSVLVRTYAWVVLLQHDGIINKTLIALGVTARPLDLLYTDGAVLVAMTHVLLPFMILPIYSVLRGIPRSLNQAALSLGAPVHREFLAITLPLSLPGVAAGSVMVFTMAIGYFVVPALLGGPRSMMISTLINQQISSMLNWPFGGAIGAVVLVLAMLVVLLFSKALASSRTAESHP
jgi:mannopine transport system permease protein